MSAVMLFRIARLAIGIVGGAGSASAQPIPAVAEAHGFTRVIFAEEFDRHPLGPDVARPQWYNSMWYQPERPLERFVVGAGTLEIKSEHDGGDVSLTTIRRDTREGTFFRRGYFEARMKWDSTPETWAAFWLFSVQHARGTDNGRWCEIDIIESMRPFTFTGTVHDWKDFRSSHNRGNDVRLGLSFDVSAWHTYGLLFTDDQLSWYLDGRKILSATPPSICLSQDLFLVLTSQAHGEHPGVRPTAKSVPQRSVYFDWVRVYGR